MHHPDPDDDAKLAALLASAAKDAAAPDRAVLERLREESLLAFRTATPVTLRRPPVMRSYFRWAAAVAAVMIVGVVLAQWIARWNAPPVPEMGVAYKLEESLIDDGRIGTITDAQGIVSIKPVLHERWSPVQSRLILKPGDWLRTEARGANAAAISLINSTRLIIGPHSTVELTDPGHLRLIAGEIEVAATPKAPLELHGPDHAIVKIESTLRYRIEKDKLVCIEQEPLWLAGFKGTTANESLGSLIAAVDGRNVPLTVGFHRVTVDIRDQIARTTVEESFVNRTENVLEGVFHFPLPQDASISGFGIWIGEKLVEADVVEKQRAREIYETILREKRDPGLLEWAGGNIFKARVYPIPAHAEKRIRITYTQVLPLTGNRYRYNYALQSELLKQHPLRELSIDLTVNSAIPLRSVASPTHSARIGMTAHSGHVEFSAQEYTPGRDFEAVIEIENRHADVVVIPHRRGADGYFMVQLTPPGAAGEWERPLVPNGEPLRLLLLADTSASLDAGQRATQNAVLAALLGALTPKDTVNVAACDVNCDWIFEKPVPATPANVAAIEQTLAKRSSLGWTDLDRAFASALKISNAGTHVIYLGDGISTTGDADPAAFANRLHRLYEGRAGTFHAIALGSSYEPVVLKAIASLGGGSLRRVSGERGPQAAALELLSEIAAPGLRDLKVSFTGLRTARVYPEELPNLPAGTQQILLGRYLPEGTEQNGEIIVTGMAGNKPVRFTAKISLQDAEQGNAFIPRLWARMHLDKLLEQGGSESVKEEIIALSQEFNIITPYTSLLVLESDADRERFAVKRRFTMQDGEKFFAEGRDNAAFELKQKQMKLAGDYRTALRRKVLEDLLTLGRDSQIFQAHRPEEWRRFWLPEKSAWRYGSDEELGSPMRANPILGSLEFRRGEEKDGKVWIEPVDKTQLLAKDNFFEEAPRGSREKPDVDLFSSDPSLPENDKFGLITGANRGLGFDSDDLIGRGTNALELLGGDSFSEWQLGLRLDMTLGRFSESVEEHYHPQSSVKLRSILGKPVYESVPRLWFDSLFPPLAPATAAKEPKSVWPAPALALSRSLLRLEKLAQQKGGLAITRQVEHFESDRDELTARTRRLELVSPTAWIGRTMPDGGPESLAWCDGKECGNATLAFQLGRVRDSNKNDLARPPLELGDESLTPLHVSHAEFVPTIEAVGPDRVLLILKHRQSRDDYQVRYLIDTRRHLLLSVEQRSQNKAFRLTKFDDFAEAAGCWWARRIETLDGDGRRQSLATQTIAELPAAEFTKRFTKELAAKSPMLFLPSPLPTLDKAKAAIAAGQASFEDRAVLTLHFAETQQWARAQEHLRECERLAGGKPGMRWLMNAFLAASRRNEELHERLLQDAAALAASQDAKVRANDHFLAEQLFQQAQPILQVNELLILADKLKPVYERQPAWMQALKAWRNRRMTLLMQAGQFDEALPLSKALAVDYPKDRDQQYFYARHLARSGDFPAAYAWLNAALAGKWARHEEDSLRGLFAELLQEQGRYRELADFLAAWLARIPGSEQRYGQYLQALVYSSRGAQAEELASLWLREAKVQGEWPEGVEARLGAAMHFALGTRSRTGQRWQKPLVELTLFFARDLEKGNILDTILNDRRLQESDAAQAARKTIAGILVKEISTLPPRLIESFINCDWADGSVDVKDWKAIAAGLHKRWQAEQKPEIRHHLGQLLLRVLGRFESGDAVAFQREQWKTAAADDRVENANELFAALMRQPWTDAVEEEAFTLLDNLAAAEEPAAGLFTRVAALHRLTDAMLEARERAAMAKLEHPEKLTRTELQKKQTEIRKLAQEGYAERLKTAAAKAARPFTSWLLAERLWLETRLGRNGNEIAAECWKQIDAVAAKADPDDDGSIIAAALDEILRGRLLAMIENIAARQGADAALGERLLTYFDQQMREHPGQSRWRGEKYRLLIALDRPKELEAELRRWLAAGEAGNLWRLALGRLLAEQGKLAEAIALFETVEAADELTAADYRSLAEWSLAENRRGLHEKAKAAFYQAMDEDRLRQQINVFLRPWQSEGHIPTRLDPEVLAAFKALFAKSAMPQNYLWQLQAFYAASHDFRYLGVLAESAIGQSAEKVYPFLGGLHRMLAEVRGEATADELAAKIAAVRVNAKSPVDQRALDLLELLFEQRAAELQNQPGPHAEKALSALVRSCKREWSPGEPRLMADFLAGLGKIPQEALANEQLRQLELLHVAAARGSFDRLHIARRRAETLYAYSHTGEAMDRLEAALNEYAAARGGTLPTSANDALNALIAIAESARHFERSEKLLLTQLQHPIHAEQKKWLLQRLDSLYLSALLHHGTVSLGQDAALYKALEAKLFAELNVNDQNQRFALLGQIANLYRTAHSVKIVGTAEDLQAFAAKRLPPLLKEQVTNYETIIRDFADTLHNIAGPRAGIAFLLDRIDDEPEWLRYSNQESWTLYSERLGQWRHETKNLGDLEPRLLRFTLTELRRDLRDRQSHNHVLYDRRYGYFWPAKEAEFAQVAEEVLAERKASSASVEYIAEYLYRGLPREPRAIEILLAAHAGKILAESGQWQLVLYLHGQQRFAESIPLLLPLIERQPEKLDYRLKLMHAYYRSGRQNELLALLKATDAFFHAKDRWSDGPLAELAHSCLENHLYAESAAYYGELIPRHQRSAPGRGIGDGTLANYYAEAAQAYAGLGKTKEAVDMASAAVVSWGADQRSRRQALDALVQVLAAAADLAAYVAELDKEKLQSPVIRKAIGLAYMKKNDHALAIRQLRLAAELQPNDAEINDALIACFDKVNDKEGAVRQLLQAAELSRRDLKLYEQLGNRLAALNQPVEAERAYTSMVEIQANEAESHALLAEVREKQNRWPEAMAEWRRVAALRALEPTGLLRLAKAQLHEKAWDKAAETLGNLRRQTWPDRFKDLPAQIRELEKALENRPIK